MAEVIRMPKMSDTMTEGVIVSWLKKVGDDVKPGDILAEVETDKATMELENYVKGTLLHIGIEKGQAVPVDAVIAVVGQKGEDFAALLSGDQPKAVEEKKEASTTSDKNEEVKTSETKPESKPEEKTAEAKPETTTPKTEIAA